MPFISRFILLLGVLLVSACAQQAPAFAPPSERPVAANETPWPKNHVLGIAYHDIEDRDPDQAVVAVRTERMIEQLAWLRENDYKPVTIDQILAAHKGGPELPAKAILLSFDDGYASFYTRVLPVLRAYNWHALLAPVGVWIDTPANQQVDFAGQMRPRSDFLTWEQVREISKSGLVEIAAHTDASHKGILANPQGNLQPAAATRRYDATTGRYETEEAFQARMRTDVVTISEKIRKAVGYKPRVWVWPYGTADGSTLQIINDQGYQMALTLDDGLDALDDLMSSPRFLVASDPDGEHFANSIVAVQADAPMRVVHVDLDNVYDPDPAQQEINLGKLIQRMADMGANTVFLQAFADPQGDGLVHSLYFPNRHLPVRADIFDRVAWQLRTRAHVKVFAWMPVLSYALDSNLPRVTRWDPKTGTTSVDPDQYKRLSPFDPNVRRIIGEIYEDVARLTSVDGILYHDDAVLSDFEDAGPEALKVYAANGLPGSIAALRDDPAALQRWTRFKSRYLIDFTKELTAKVRAIRGPQVLTARNIFAEPMLNPQSEAWFAQNLDDFLGTYDWTAPMAMPLMEKQSLAQSGPWLEALVATVKSRPGALQRTVFELQAKDWTKKTDSDIDGAQLSDWMGRLKRQGATSFGYYPDNFLENQPDVKTVRPALSNKWNP
ncbi:MULTISPECIES: poly-beta-1,6-N-acetyl-D-glucosamine N-deacetylase PgaB [unclassified Pseudomonas]|uniref:poly-beta-1,6-N-acetyl-D-glucosamine N-deacetylase PgaB n=1 Tax=unclassified Pseudomonas TaxID=196821 RepID=UPI001911F50C|nr:MULTISPECIES: poly-beta-1,6-N-acetyl-D-glucosamine N-deacetylase PgaB [unclassified Pseudomonas]MBK5509623.1 poly-beta-1,6-N-acetyl-D-glucosamine N-deacetylase PgaB [Pseudomonas sp. TH15]MBK5549827.1 poly-beta-1,6-N-acetyl-D-glucosamine N-deacetylase PgaB [Pseudomonas sp. TH03]MEB0224054.1 poly-beta-1,6-N-acetyl-D-glucosamine N-deacetylase PgaB [Pseudomonas sp. 5S1]MEB0296269.1 poly-beta-1,6-N-acetyl-D-glucosamine N-deacetylase PgaB [Pseudomonas sp. 10S4]WPX20088.1 poly-beta-1,6-N-acetyl-D-